MLAAASSARADDVPVPMPRPERPAAVPVPEPRPNVLTDDVPADDAPADDVPGEGASRSPAAQTMPAEELACRRRLRDRGVAFDDQPAVSDESGCRIDWPLLVRSLGHDVALAPEGVMTCALAERAASFVQDVARPRAAERLGSPVARLHHASTYVCRPRNGTARLSEHAFGNALDIAAFELADGRMVAVGQAEDVRQAGFLLALRLAACGPFTTVLGPGTDADHATHFHVDLATRRAGSAYCR